VIRFATVATLAAAAGQMSVLAQTLVRPPNALQDPVPQPSFRAGIELVRLDVSVMRNGQPVRGLGARDFSIRDRGVLQQVESVSGLDDLPVSVLIALDTSGSVAGERLAHLVDAGQALLAALRPDDRAALITFSRDIRVRVPLTSDRSALAEGLANLSGEGPTAIRDAVWVALQLRPNDNSRPLVLLFSDGVDNASWLSRSAIVAGVQRAGVVVHAVELVDGSPPMPMLPVMPMARGTIAALPAAPQSFLEELVGAAGGRIWSATASRGLRELFARAIDEMRARYLISFYPEGVRREGWHELKMSVDVPGSVTARPGYFVPSRN
jgi:Ca-activated chloride channel family protein